MTADALQQITEALRDRLTAALTSSGVPGTVFVGPLDDPNAGGAALVLFLYRVVPNASLRNREHRVPSSTPGQQVDVFQNALPLDLYYLLTVGRTPDATVDRLLSALGFAMQALQGDPDLTGPAVNYEPVRVTLEPLTTEEASRIWTLFPTANYRTSIAYLATPVWIDPPQAPQAAAPVGEDQLFAGVKAAEVMP
jgi:hypothetical protein